MSRAGLEFFNIQVGAENMHMIEDEIMTYALIELFTEGIQL